MVRSEKEKKFAMIVLITFTATYLLPTTGNAFEHRIVYSKGNTISITICRFQ